MITDRFHPHQTNSDFLSVRIISPTVNHNEYKALSLPARCRHFDRRCRWLCPIRHVTPRKLCVAETNGHRGKYICRKEDHERSQTLMLAELEVCLAHIETATTATKTFLTRRPHSLFTCVRLKALYMLNENSTMNKEKTAIFRSINQYSDLSMKQVNNQPAISSINETSEQSTSHQIYQWNKWTINQPSALSMKQVNSQPAISSINETSEQSWI